MLENKTITNNDIIYSQDNNFVESRFVDFTVIELKVIEFLISQTNFTTDKIYINKKQNKFISVKAVDLAKTINANPKNMYNVATELVSGLLKKSIEVGYIDKRGKRAFKGSNFFNNIKYENNTFEFEINYAILNHFIELKKYFTQINLKYITALKSVYAIKLYKLLIQFKTIKTRILTVDEIRTFLVLGDKFKQFSEVRKNVVEIAVKQINEFTELFVDYEENKSGRTTQSITFNIKSNGFKLIK